jgi:hypothetical protein
MKIFSAAGPVNRVTARNCFLVNQFATPGLGSLMGGKVLPGIGQLALAVTGFVLVIVWFALTLIQAYDLTDFSREANVKSCAPWGEAGALVFAASWIWALATSIGLLQEAKRAGIANPTPLPPPIAPPSSKNPDSPG